MKYDNEFTCTNGHTFRANAKSHARCPECGKLTRRSFTVEQAAPAGASVGTVGDPSAPTVPTTTTDDSNKLQLIRKGKDRSVVAAVKKTLPKRVNGRFVSSKKKKPAATKTTRKSTELVTHKTLGAGTKKKPTVPRVTRKPPRTAVARHVQNGGGKKSYADEMIENYGFRR